MSNENKRADKVRLRCGVYGKFLEPGGDNTKINEKNVPLCWDCDIEYPEESA